MIAWIKSNRLLSVILLVCAGFFAYYIFNSIHWIPYPNSIDYGEGFVMNYAKMWANGTWKWDVNIPPYLTMVYGVGFSILAYPFVKLFGATLLVGRALSFSAALIACFLLYLITTRLTGKKSYGLLAALLPATQPIFRDWSVMARVDMPAVMFDLLGFYIVVKFKDSKWFYLAIIPFLCAMMIKLSAIAGLIAVGIYLLIYNRKRFLAFAGLSAIGLIAILIPLMIVSDGTYLNHIVTYQNTIKNIHLGTFLFLFNMMIYSILILLVLVIVYLRRCLHKREYTLAGIFFVVAFVTNTLATFRPGAASMYYFETIIATCICACLALPYVLSYFRRKGFQPQGVVIIVVLVMIFGYYGVQHNIESPDEQYTEAVTIVETIMSDSKNPIITENPAIALNMGKDLYMEYFIFTNMTRLGYWDETAYVEKYNEQYFDYVVLRVSLSDRVRDVSNGRIDGDFTDAALMAIDGNYTLVYETVNRYWPYSLFLYEANGKLQNDDRPIVQGFEMKDANLVWDGDKNEWAWREY